MGNSTEILAERETLVLKTVLAHYIQTGEPVGSRTVAKFSGLNLSAATIRNLMLELEERGYLSQPHTSAGRVPTPLGFRYYVDRILPIQGLGAGIQRQIEEAFTPSAADPQELFRQASRALSTASCHPALVLSPRPQGMLLKHIQFIALGGDGILCLLVAQDQQVQTRFLRVDASYTQEQLDRFSRYLNEICQNLTLAEARYRILRQMEPYCTRANMQFVAATSRGNVTGREGEAPAAPKSAARQDPPPAEAPRPLDPVEVSRS